MAATGVAQVISPVHTSFDGDVVFALSLGKAAADPDALGAVASDAVALRDCAGRYRGAECG